VKTADVYPEPDTVIVTFCAVDGNVYVLDAMPLLSVVALGVPNVPPAPPSLNVTETPAAGLPLLVANIVNALGRVDPGLPVWLLPAFGVRS